MNCTTGLQTTHKSKCNRTDTVGAKVPWNLTLLGTKVPSLELLLSGTKVPRSESACYHIYRSCLRSINFSATSHSSLRDYLIKQKQHLHEQ